MPLPPPTHGAKVDVIDVGMSIIAGPQPLEKVQMLRQDDRIIQVRHGKRLLVVMIHNKHLGACILQPVRVIRSTRRCRTTHDAERQLLTGGTCVREDVIEKRVIDLTGPRLQDTPAPARIMDCRRDPVWQILVLVLRDVEGLPADAGVGQQCVSFFRPNGHKGIRWIGRHTPAFDRKAIYKAAYQHYGHPRITRMPAHASSSNTQTPRLPVPRPTQRLMKRARRDSNP